jgi:hypothetical protein
MPFTVSQVFPAVGVTGDEGEVWWQLKELLVAAGWTVTLSSDGITAGPFTQDHLDPGGPYTGTMDNNDAWFVVQAPGVDNIVREIMIQNTATTGRIRFWYSSDGVGFSGGGTTTRPTAADEEFLQDSGDNILLTSNPQLVAVNFMIGDATEGYSFLVEVHPYADVGLLSGCFMDVLSEPLAVDGDPAVLSCFTAGANAYYRSDTQVFTTTAVNLATTNIAGWFRKGTGSEAWVAYPLGHPGYGDGPVGTLQMWHIENDPGADGAFPMLPVIYHRGTDPFGSTGLGYKGISRLFQIIPYRDGDPLSQLIAQDETLAAWHGIVRPWAAGLDKRW